MAGLESAGSVESGGQPASRPLTPERHSGSTSSPLVLSASSVSGSVVSVVVWRFEAQRFERASGMAPTAISLAAEPADTVSTQKITSRTQIVMIIEQGRRIVSTICLGQPAGTYGPYNCTDASDGKLGAFLV